MVESDRRRKIPLIRTVRVCPLRDEPEDIQEAMTNPDLNPGERIIHYFCKS